MVKNISGFEIFTLILTILIFLFLIFFSVIFIYYIRNSKYPDWLYYRRNKKSLSSIEEQRKNLLFYQLLSSILIKMHNQKIGALIVIKKNDNLSAYKKTGYQVHASFSPEFLMNIFSNKKSALHDGAIIIENREIVTISAYLPVTKNIIDIEFGARHRAALGLSEKTDACIFVVSERTGKISFAQNGKISELKINNIFNEIKNLLQ